MQSLSGHSLMRQQVPMVFLLRLVYLSAVACISEEINLGPRWRKDILRVKGQALLSNCNYYEFVRPICNHRGNYSICHQVSMIFLLLLVYQRAAACIFEHRNFGPSWRKDI